MNYSTETIATLDTNRDPLGYRRPQQRSRVRRLEAQRSMRPVAIVVVGVQRDGSLEVLLIQDQQPVETLRANGAYEAFRHAVRLRDAKRRANDLAPGVRNTSSKLSVNFWSRSRIKKRTGSGWLAKAHVSCRPCCVTH